MDEEHLVRLRSQAGAQREGRPLAPARRAAYVAVLKGFFAFLDKRGLILAEPGSVLALPGSTGCRGAVLSERRREG